MTGEPVNISNIEKKFKEGYEAVADKVKNADYDKYGKKVKSSGTGFFDALGNIFLTILKIFVKFFGIILMFVSLVTLICLIIGLFTAGSVDFWGDGVPMDYLTALDLINTPIWLFALCLLLAVGIPFFVLFVLGLKMLISNLKSLGTPVKLSLLILWVLSLIGLGIMGARQATQQAYNGDFITENELQVVTGDTLTLSMRSDNHFSHSVYRSGGFEIDIDENGNKVVYSNDVRLIVRSTTDAMAKLVVEKSAVGNSYADARGRAQNIEWEYELDNGTLYLDGYFTTALENKYRDQEINLTLYLPEGTILYAEGNTYSFHRNSSYYNDILDNGDEEHYLRILKNKTECLDCPPKEERYFQSDDEGWEDDVREDFDDDTTVIEETVTDTTEVSSDLEETQTVTDSTQINN